MRNSYPAAERKSGAREHRSGNPSTRSEASSLAQGCRRSPFATSSLLPASSEASSARQNRLIFAARLCTAPSQWKWLPWQWRAPHRAQDSTRAQ